MDGKEHYERAEVLIDSARDAATSEAEAALLLAEAQVHATLALAAVQIDAGVCGHGYTGVCMYCVRDAIVSMPRP